MSVFVWVEAIIMVLVAAVCLAAVWRGRLRRRGKTINWAKFLKAKTKKMAIQDVRKLWRRKEPGQ